MFYFTRDFNKNFCENLMKAWIGYMMVNNAIFDATTNNVMNDQQNKRAIHNANEVKKRRFHSEILRKFHQILLTVYTPFDTGLWW